MRRMYLILLALLCSTISPGQIFSSTPGSFPGMQKLKRSTQPGRKLPDYPTLIASPEALARSLPVVVDNSDNPFMRSVFRQQGASCGQSASIGYNYCYEINRLRNLPSDTIANTYTDHFAYNFMNTSTPYGGIGVSYFHTFDVMYDAGTPTEAVYGNIETDDDYRWMSGYENYYSAMLNRIAGIKSIHAGTPQGLEVLKQWLHNHLEGSPIGGLASFYGGINVVTRLPAQSPEAGKSVITQWASQASHAMTIVGYHDSIRIDRNGDNQFTNHLDINNDGITDMRDWEIGGVKIVNSYGPDWENNGYCYVLYSTLATEYGKGGIWNNSAHVILPDTAYKPLLTAKAIVSHNRRVQLRIRAGISSDTSHWTPDYQMQFSIFNYQGGNYFMSGGKLPEDKTLEMGLDITPLLSFVRNEKPYRIFLMIDEEDPESGGEGMLHWLEVYKHTGESVVSFVSADSSLSLVNNGTTTACVNITAAANPPAIKGDSNIIVPPSGYFEFTPLTEGGTPPLEFTLLHRFDFSDSLAPFLPLQGNNINPLTATAVAVALPFSFPWHGQTYDTVYMHRNGYILFTKSDLPYFYQIYDEPYLKQISAIIPNFDKTLNVYTSSDYMKVLTTSDSVRFSWKASNSSGGAFAEFSATLCRSGNIRFHYGESNTIIPFAGLSNGSPETFLLAEYSGTRVPAGTIRNWIPSRIPGRISCTEAGTVKVEDITGPAAGKFVFQVRDKNRLSASKQFVLANGPIMRISLANPGNILSPGSIHNLKVEIFNPGSSTTESASLLLEAATSNCLITGKPIEGLQLKPGTTSVPPGHFKLIVHDTVSRPSTLSLKCRLTADSMKFVEYETFRTAHREIAITPPSVSSDNNGIPEPGENVQLSFTIYNYGEADLGKTSVTLTVNSPFAAITGSSGRDTGIIGARSARRISFPLSVNNATPPGKIIALELILNYDDDKSFTQTFYLTLGHPSIAVIDCDNNLNSARHIAAAIRQAGFESEQFDEIAHLKPHHNTAFLSLGFFHLNHKLSHAEDSLLVGFLDNGGNLYLEGGAFFRQDPETVLRQKLSVTGLNQAWVYKADSLEGNPGTPAEPFRIHYRGDNLRGENLQPDGTAVPWFTDKNSGLHFIIANRNETYSTVASTIEFGGTFMYGTSPGRPELAKEYLNFLGYETHPLCATFVADTLSVCPGEPVTFRAFTSGSPEAMQWHFPGGDPEYSTESSPEVSYSVPGSYTVTLTVQNQAGESNTFSVNEYIHIFNCLGIPGTNQPTFLLYPNPAREFVTIVPPGNDRPWTARLTDMRGRTVRLLSGTGKTVAALGNPDPGFYLLMLVTDNKQITLKLAVY